MSLIIESTSESMRLMKKLATPPTSSDYRHACQIFEPGYVRLGNFLVHFRANNRSHVRSAYRLPDSRKPFGGILIITFSRFTAFHKRRASSIRLLCLQREQRRRNFQADISIAATFQLSQMQLKEAIWRRPECRRESNCSTVVSRSLREEASDFNISS